MKKVYIKVCVNCKICKKLRCFLEKITQLTKILHDRRSRRSRQISSLADDDDDDGVQEKADTEWKFARSKLWISYFEACNHLHHHCHCHHHHCRCHGFWFIPIIPKSHHAGVTTHLGTT